MIVESAALTRYRTEVCGYEADGSHQPQNGSILAVDSVPDVCPADLFVLDTTSIFELA